MYISYVESKAAYTLLAIVCFVFGFALNFLGYRFYRLAMIASGLFAGGDYAATVVAAIIDGFETESAYWAAFWVGGVVIGLVAALHATVGTVISGFVAGVQVAFMIMGMASYTGTVTLQVVWASVGGVICAGLIMFSRKPGLAAATSFVGAVLFMDGVSHFVNHKIFNDSYENTSTSRARNAYFIDHIRSAWWTMTGVTIALFVVGIPIQLLLTARGVDYEAAARQQAENGNSDDAHYVQEIRGGRRDFRDDAPHFEPVLSPLNDDSGNNNNAKASRYVAANPIAYA